MKLRMLRLNWTAKLSHYALVAVLIVPAMACLSKIASAQTAPTVEINDPLEGVNRYIFDFNDAVDTYLLKPVAEAYVDVIPQGGRNGVHNVLLNINEPLVLVNQLLQGNISDAGETVARFLLNSTFGLVGIFDIGPDFGLPYKSADFGQTMAVWGVPSGPYLVLPILGPSNIRDTAGLVGDYYGNPVHLALWSDSSGVSDDTADILIATKSVVSAIDTRARLLKAVADIKKNSLDYYSAVRSVYSQRRAAQLRNPQEKTTVPSYGVSY